MARFNFNLSHIYNFTRITKYLFRKCWLYCLAYIFFIFIVCSLFECFLYYAIILSIIIVFLLSIYFATDWLIYHPNDPEGSRVNVCSPEILKLPYLNTYITTIDGLAININFFIHPIQNHCPTIVYFHGNAGNIGHRLLSASHMFNLNCNVLLVEYRGFGLSKGTPSEKGLYLDGKAAINFLQNYPNIDKDKIIVFGRSLGGAVAIHMAYDRTINNKIRALIVENTFTSIPEIARQTYKCRLVQILPNWMYKSHFDSKSKISNIYIPVLFLSGLSDQIVPSSMMRTLFDLCPSKSKCIKLFQDGRHNFTWMCNEYHSTISDFLNSLFTPVSLINVNDTPLIDFTKTTP